MVRCPVTGFKFMSTFVYLLLGCIRSCLQLLSILSFQILSSVFFRSGLIGVLVLDALLILPFAATSHSPVSGVRRPLATPYSFRTFSSSVCPGATAMPTPFF